MKVSKIIVYPIKALRAVELEEAEVTKEGFPNDRRFMILHVTKDKDGNTGYKNVHVAHYPESVLFFPSLDTAAGTMTVTYKPPQSESKTIDIPLRPDISDLSTINIEMHKSPTKAYQMPQEYNDWFSACYAKEVILVYLGEHLRPVLMSSTQTPQTSTNSATGWLSSITSTAAAYLPSSNSNSNSLPSPGITFADCAPYLVASETSMDDLQTRLESEKMDIIKFRPNIIVSGAEEAWEEDFWSELTIGSNTKIECVHNCGRCKSINIDYETGLPGTTEQGTMLKKMQKDRRVDAGVKYSPIFGRYSFLGEGCEGEVVRVGDEVVVSRRNEERTKFDWKGLATS
ncbi:MOSC domain-containing protein [Zymoseptoria brevis]|uniref:MOSC domain-containing protein n=1 Tax=Zymoseptoria brevis TaxID=1047168 RepID=A0A0F4GYT7_9PEZI|nr:MOSC domain-containing protein [Zymoseptoria brevis]